MLAPLIAAPASDTYAYRLVTPLRTCAPANRLTRARPSPSEYVSRCETVLFAPGARRSPHDIATAMSVGVEQSHVSASGVPAAIALRRSSTAATSKWLPSPRLG